MPSARLCVTLGAWAALLACGADPPGPASPPTCAERVSTMRRHLADIPTDIDDLAVIHIPDGMELPDSARGVPIGDGMPLFVRADGSFVFDQTPHPSAAAVHAALAEEFEKANQLSENTGRPFRPMVLHVIDARAPVRVVAELIDLWPSNVSHAQVVHLAGDVVPAAPPIPEPVRVAVDDPDMPGRSSRIADLADRALGTCEAIRRAFGAVAETTADDRSRVLVEGLPKAVESCACASVDVETLTAIVWAMNGRQARRTRMLALPVTSDREAPRVKLPSAATGRDLARLAERPHQGLARLELVP